MQQTNEGGAHYCVLLKNDVIGFKVIERIKSNTRDVVLACLKRFMAWLRHEMGNMLKILRSDRGSDFIGVKLKNHLEQLEVKQEFTTNYKPKQNKVSKKDKIVEVARSMLHANNINLQFWGESYEYSSVCT
jgi:hypothetical protein